MALLGADYLQRNAERVNALNVFPVPDGDTGTNMNLTMSSGVRELRSKPSAHLGKAAEALSKGLLMGARGNSGVILSQLFRGFSKSLAGLEEAGAAQVAAALQHGVDLAYKAVVKPVEGTILTVAKEAAKHAVQYARRKNDVAELMREVHRKAEEALQRTPDLLPVLKQVGVVDSGGQGLVFIYEGFANSLSGSESDGYSASHALSSEAAPPEEVAVPAAGRPQETVSAQSRLSTEAIEFLYDMEFFINRKLGGAKPVFFNESAYKKALEKDGDSILVIAEEDVIKVHVHSRKPGDVLNLSLPYGELNDIRILNMREQHRELLGHEAEAGGPADYSAAELLAGSVPATPPGQVFERAPFGIIAVAMGEGIADIFLGNDVDTVLSGGQTMNPSTEDFVKAIESLSAEHIYILPNNGNIILAAEQAAELSERSVTVIPTRTVPQGLAAVLAFKEEESAERNAAWMKSAAEQVVSGQVTKAVRDTSIEGVTIREGDFIGIKEKTIVVSEPSLTGACKGLIGSMLEEGGDLLTVLTGEGADSAETAEICEWVAEQYPELELEVQKGGQPLYPYIFALE
ncbi:DAK2 domain-containing protein [Paenibacillus arenilitoris]|uniref:DAK2 domain-containing protein n=1 Tax=Paenibacillus arenilitoris TaxID=2772299 RepID=A0A927CQ32_9BACL|nr:DAK2 domain-containing protein [Paenibacillus arenilitoris]MBD2871440.1 DAK2 domain-containing protein [Paenibacillus arenilitoris]